MAKPTKAPKLPKHSKDDPPVQTLDEPDPDPPPTTKPPEGPGGDGD